MNLNPGVVNVLIDFTLKINNNKLTKAYIEAIASQWAKSKIETVEDAMAIASKEYKLKQKSKPKIKEEKPEWFDKEFETVKTSEEELQEIEDLYNAIR